MLNVKIIILMDVKIIILTLLSKNIIKCLTVIQRMLPN